LSFRKLLAYEFNHAVSTVKFNGNNNIVKSQEGKGRYIFSSLIPSFARWDSRKSG
jgi:hypothetical protein